MVSLNLERLVPTVLAATLLGSGCVSPPPAEVRVVTADGEAPAFAADSAAILDELEAWRGLPFLEDLVVDVVPASEVSDGKLNGWYESSTKRLVVVEGNSTAMGRGTLLHEMFHALQDQHFDLGRLHTEVAPLGTDAQRALQALIEGEAMLAVSELMNYDFERHAHLPEAGPIDPERFGKIFHYGAGLRFVRAVREAGGWEAVADAFRRPPRTTAEIYHPDRYIDPKPAIDIPGMPVENAIGPATARGEFEVRLFLAQSETLRPRVDELAGHVVSDLAWSTSEGSVWRLHFDDQDALEDVLMEANSLAGRLIVTVGPTGGILTVYSDS